MKNKKGFTLVELLAVIVILGILLVIAVPKVIEVIDNTRLVAFYMDGQTLEKAADKYVSLVGITLDVGNETEISYQTLKNASYISEIKDPISKEECINSKVVVSRTSENVYEYNAALVCDNYINLEEYNLIKNYDFSAGDTDWTGVDSTISTSSNILTDTGTGAYNLPVVSQYTNMDSLLNHKIYIYTKARLTNSDYTKMTIIISSSIWNWNEVVTNTNSRMIKWYDMSTITTIDSGYSGYVRLMISHGYNDAATANGKIMEIDGTVGVYLIDLTDIYGAGNEPTKDDMDNIINNMT